MAIHDQLERSSLSSKLAWLEQRYFRNGRDEVFQEHLYDLLEVDDNGELTPRPRRNPLNDETRGLAIIGPSDAGKTVLIQRNLKSIECLRKMDGEPNGNYLEITVPPDATIKSLAKSLLEQTGYAGVSANAKAYDTWEILRHRIEKFQVGLIWIDECHHLLAGGPGRDRATALRMLKNLVQGKGAASVVISGVPQLEEELVKDAETSRRFQRFQLTPVSLESVETDRVGQFLLVCCEQLEVEPPADDFIAERIVFASNGSPGGALELVKDSIRRALISHEPKLTLGHFERSLARKRESTDIGPFMNAEWPVLRTKLEKRGWA